MPPVSIEELRKNPAELLKVFEELQRTVGWSLVQGYLVTMHAVHMRTVENAQSGHDEILRAAGAMGALRSASQWVDAQVTTLKHQQKEKSK